MERAGNAAETPRPEYLKNTVNFDTFTVFFGTFPEIYGFDI